MFWLSEFVRNRTLDRNVLLSAEKSPIKEWNTLFQILKTKPRTFELLEVREAEELSKFWVSCSRIVENSFKLRHFGLLWY